MYFLHFSTMYFSFSEVEICRSELDWPGLQFASADGGAGSFQPSALQLQPTLLPLQTAAHTDRQSRIIIVILDDFRDTIGGVDVVSEIALARMFFILYGVVVVAGWENSPPHKKNVSIA